MYMEDEEEDQVNVNLTQQCKSNNIDLVQHELSEFMY